MDVYGTGRRAIWSWVSMAVLVVLVSALAVLQYRWIGEISVAERERLQEGLESGLTDVSRDFNAELNAALAALAVSGEDSEAVRESAYASRFAVWKASAAHPGWFSRLALAWNQDGATQLRILSRDQSAFARAEWPADWSGTREWIESRARGGFGGGRGPGEFPRARGDRYVIDMPRFRDPPRYRGGDGGFEQPGERYWVLAEVDPAYTASTVLPALLERHLGTDYRKQYRVEVTPRDHPAEVVYHSDPEARITAADAIVTLFSAPQESIFFGRGRGPGPRREGGPPEEKGPGPRRGFPDRDFGRGGRGPGPNPGGGRWELAVQLRAGSLEAFVARARERNLIVSGAIFVLLLGTSAWLIRLSRQSQRLAEVQMEFVTGVSHQLRTPLTVLRTAGFNLRGKLASDPLQVERYGALIQHHSEKLAASVEQVLQFASFRKGRVLHEQTPIDAAELLEESLQASCDQLAEIGCAVEQSVAPELPRITGDRMALRGALENLIANAIKYGMTEEPWLGVSARRVEAGGGRAVEICVADHGPGIPPDEQKHIFDAFFRGRKGVSDQIHGTGLGLNLAKKIIEAHGGTIVVESREGAGTRFIVRLPARAAEPPA